MLNYKFEAEHNVRRPGILSLIGQTIQVVEILLVVTPPGECNCFNLHSVCSVHFYSLTLFLPPLLSPSLLPFSSPFLPSPFRSTNKKL